MAAGETVATVYSDDSALQTVSRIETLELQLQQLQFALTSYLDPDAALKLDTSITGDILTLRQTLSAGDYAAAESDLAALKAAVLKRDHGAIPHRRRYRPRSNRWRVRYSSRKPRCPARRP